LIASVGVTVCFALNAVSFFGTIFALTAMRPEEFHAGHIRSRVPLLVSIREGLRYASKTKTIAIVLLMLFTISLFSINFNVLLPVLARQTLHGGAQTYGLIAAVFGGGAFVGALLSASREKASRGLLLLTAGAFGLGEVVVASTTSIPVVCLALFLTGAAYTIYTSSTNSIVQLATPGFLQGRIAGLYSYVFIGSGPFGALLAGWLSEVGGTALAFWVAGLAAVGMTAIGFATRPWPMPTGSVGSLRRLRPPWTLQDVHRRPR
jgi:MFS family permease